VVLEAEALLDSVSRKRNLETAQPDRPGAEDDAETEGLAADLLRTLSEQESRDVAEAARETEWTAPSFVRELFLGNLRLDLIHPYPRQSPEDKAKTDAYIAKLRKPSWSDVDSDAIDRTGELPPEVVQGCATWARSASRSPRSTAASASARWATAAPSAW
jgi:hypothetical protein